MREEKQRLEKWLEILRKLREVDLKLEDIENKEHMLLGEVEE
jgi:hypothetical protein